MIVITKPLLIRFSLPIVLFFSYHWWYVQWATAPDTNEPLLWCKDIISMFIVNEKKCLGQQNGQFKQIRCLVN